MIFSLKSMTINLSPKPSILKAFLETKCFNFSTAWEGQLTPEIHLLIASLFGLYVFPPHDGQKLGGT